MVDSDEFQDYGGLTIPKFLKEIELEVRGMCIGGHHFSTSADCLLEAASCCG
jgi:hypothetical protein